MTTNREIVPLDPTERANWMTLVKTTLARAANLSDNELQVFATVSEHLGLDVWRKEIYAIRYGKNNPVSFVIGVDGYLRKAAETGLVAKVRDRQVTFGESLEEAMRLASLVEGDAVVAAVGVVIVDALGHRVLP